MNLNRFRYLVLILPILLSCSISETLAFSAIGSGIAAAPPSDEAAPCIRFDIYDDDLPPLPAGESEVSSRGEEEGCRVEVIGPEVPKKVRWYLRALKWTGRLTLAAIAEAAIWELIKLAVEFDNCGQCMAFAQQETHERCHDHQQPALCASIIGFALGLFCGQVFDDCSEYGY